MPDKEKTPKNNTADSKKTSKRAVLIIVAVMIVMVGIAVYVGTSSSSGGMGSTVDVSIPLIVTTLTQPSTGQDYNVQTLFSVRLDKNARTNISDKELEEALTSIMQQMDIDKILDKGKVDYINTRTTELLTEQLNIKGANPRVVVVDLATDDRVQLAIPEDRSNDIMEGIFQNID